MMKLTKVFQLGKVAYSSTRKINAVDVVVELREIDEKLEFSVCGAIWNSKHTDCFHCGQCLETIAEYVKTPLFNEIYRLWKAYHLNTMHEGTERQEQALIAKFGDKHASRFAEEFQYLKSIDLLEDKEYLYNGKPYIYGSGHLYREIPAVDLEKIMQLLKS